MRCMSILTNWSHHRWTNQCKYPGVETVSKVSRSKYLKITAICGELCSSIIGNQDKQGACRIYMAWLKTKLNIHHLDVMNMPCPWGTTWLMASGFTKHKVLSNFKLPSGKTVLISSRWSGGSSGHPHPSFLVVHHTMFLTTIDHPNMAEVTASGIMNMYHWESVYTLHVAAPYLRTPCPPRREWHCWYRLCPTWHGRS